MPTVDISIDIDAPAGPVWEAVLDIERYPSSMENVRWVEIREAIGPAERRTAWSIVVKGSILEWEDMETIDHEAMVVSFHQLSGDLSEFDGRWEVTRRGPGLSTARFAVDFEIGIPLLAEMLNPMATRSLRENCTEMLKGVERKVLAT
ncbi:MAG TPA: SRPBCC family protein [Solirubrobacterales bacterium]|nr:SRPBCC family protein [Solirubrobacterales bacterium]